MCRKIIHIKKIFIDIIIFFWNIMNKYATTIQYNVIKIHVFFHTNVNAWGLSKKNMKEYKIYGIFFPLKFENDKYIPK